jgi:hypothetical protein
VQRSRRQTDAEAVKRVAEEETARHNADDDDDAVGKGVERGSSMAVPRNGWGTRQKTYTWGAWFQNLSGQGFRKHGVIGGR